MHGTERCSRTRFFSGLLVLLFCWHPTPVRDHRASQRLSFDNHLHPAAILARKRGSVPGQRFDLDEHTFQSSRIPERIESSSTTSAVVHWLGRSERARGAICKEGTECVWLLHRRDFLLGLQHCMVLTQPGLSARHGNMGRGVQYRADIVSDVDCTSGSSGSDAAHDPARRASPPLQRAFQVNKPRPKLAGGSPTGIRVTPVDALVVLDGAQLHQHPAVATE